MASNSVALPWKTLRKDIGKWRLACWPRQKAATRTEKEVLSELLSSICEPLCTLNILTFRAIANSVNETGRRLRRKRSKRVLKAPSNLLVGALV